MREDIFHVITATMSKSHNRIIPEVGINNLSNLINTPII